MLSLLRCSFDVDFASSSVQIPDPGAQYPSYGPNAPRPQCPNVLMFQYPSILISRCRYLVSGICVTACLVSVVFLPVQICTDLRLPSLPVTQLLNPERAIRSVKYARLLGRLVG